MTNALRLGIAGLGTVGTGVLDMLSTHAALLAERGGKPVSVTAVSARSKGKPRGNHDLSKLEWHDDPVALANSANIDVFIELIGGDEGPARKAVEAAIAAGKHVITANKALLAKHGTALARAAEAKGVALNYEAAVAGGIPAIKVVREGLAGNAPRKVFGIMNGTCNYILTKMGNEGRSFAEVLKEAQALGYAEADPTFDVGGFDTAHKLAVLTALTFGTEVNLDAITIEGIENVTLEDIRNAAQLGYKIKLLGVAVRHDSGIEQRVHPTLVPKGSPVSDTDGVFNAVVVEGDFAGDLLLEGRGAGAHPTASAVLSDIVDIARGNMRPAFGVPAASLKKYQRAPEQAHRGGFYVALQLHDKPGAVAAIASILAEEGISLESIVQRGKTDHSTERDTAQFILITHDTLEPSIRKAMGKIATGGFVADAPRVIRIARI
ncbi:homoserine dehydrogenase [Aestuariivirga litoralis]|uniref:homoserine dehydrogenase n=1 Tax=Aestuariivirga litoralis TaxID=2650924 RepID=UPI0018C6867C|nr:homoserine dehydrogenase [Aestuariivirga litoralis]MBG1231772.1 homoserine dehydrogenase [Aestuariivirga litoralis]